MVPLVFSFVKLLIIASFLVSVVLILGEERERKAWAAVPSTLGMYTTDETCRDHKSGNVLNCGHCGLCSNVHDIKIYHETRSTLTGIMTECARGDWLFGNDAFECLKQGAGMTDGCSKCWVLNYKCNIQNCLNTCVKQRFFPFLPSLTSWNSEPLDHCIACDEKLCGPVFVECAGANRRRVGVVSDIERDNGREICSKVDWDWIIAESAGAVLVTENQVSSDSNEAQQDL